MIQFSARGLAPFWEIICFVAETLYQKVWQVLNFHLTLQNEPEYMEVSIKMG